MLDRAFFGKAFAEKVEEFSRDHDGMNVRVDVGTVAGERLETVHIHAAETEAKLSTSDDRVIFMPYSQIAYVSLSVLQDHRIPGFRLSSDSG